MMIYRSLRVEIASLVLFAGPFSVAWAEAPTLQQGVKALQAGNAREAAKLLTTDLEAPDRSPEERARAFYFRAKAYLAIKQPGLAIADAGAALWFKKLSPKEAADAEWLKAEAQRSAAFDTGLPAVTPVTITALPPAEAHATTPAPVEPSPPPPVLQKPRAPEQAAVLPSPAAHQPPPAWSTAEIKNEELPSPPVVPEPPTKPITAWITSSPIAAPPSPVPQEIETGSVTRPVQSSAADASGATPPPHQTIASAHEQVVTSSTQPAATQVAQPITSAASTSFLTGLPSLGSLFSPEPSPMLAEVDQANEFQRRYYEKIRQYNRDAQTRNAVQSSNLTPASDGAPAAPEPR